MSALVPSHPIKRWFAKAHAWRLRSKRRSLIRWEEEKAKGKTRFVIRSALIYSLVMTAGVDLMNEILGIHVATRFYEFLFSAIWNLSVGIIVGYVGWWSMERNYQNTLREIRIEMIAAGATPKDKQE